MVFSFAKDSVDIKNSINVRVIVRIDFSLIMMQILDFRCFYLEREVVAW